MVHFELANKPSAEICLVHWLENLVWISKFASVLPNCSLDSRHQLLLYTKGSEPMVRVPLVERGSFLGGTRASLDCMRYIVVLSNKVGLLQQFAFELLKYANNTFIYFCTKFSAFSKLLLSILLSTVIVSVQCEWSL